MAATSSGPLSADTPDESAESSRNSPPALGAKEVAPDGPGDSQGVLPGNAGQGDGGASSGVGSVTGAVVSPNRVAQRTMHPGLFRPKLGSQLSLSLETSSESSVEESLRGNAMTVCLLTLLMCGGVEGFFIHMFLAFDPSLCPCSWAFKREVFCAREFSFVSVKCQFLCRAVFLSFPCDALLTVLFSLWLRFPL